MSLSPEGIPLACPCPLWGFPWHVPVPLCACRATNTAAAVLWLGTASQTSPNPPWRGAQDVFSQCPAPWATPSPGTRGSAAAGCRRRPRSGRSCWTGRAVPVGEQNGKPQFNVSHWEPLKQPWRDPGQHWEPVPARPCRQVVLATPLCPALSSDAPAEWLHKCLSSQPKCAQTKVDSGWAFPH